MPGGEPDPEADQRQAEERREEQAPGDVANQLIADMVVLADLNLQAAVLVPLAEMFGYTTDIRSMTQGRASSTMELAHYAEVPPNVAEAVIANRSK